MSVKRHLRKVSDRCAIESRYSGTPAEESSGKNWRRRHMGLAPLRPASRRPTFHLMQSRSRFLLMLR